MLTSYQAETTGAIGEGAAYHVDHAPEGEDIQLYCRYTLESEFPDGLTCDVCGDYIVEPSPDYCIVHEEWANEFAEDYRPIRCERDGEYGEACRFAEV